MDQLYYRRVKQWNGAWQVVVEGYVRSYVGPNCTFEGPTYCSIAPPYIFEQWWRWSWSTIGTGGSWDLVLEQRNWV